MSISEKIYLLRKRSALSQEQLAEKLNVSRQAISKWESGISIPESDKLITIADFFNVSTDYLLRDEMTDISIDTNDKIKQKSRSQIIAGILFCIIGAVTALILIIIIASPTILNNVTESSIVTINGNGLLLILCITSLVIGITLILLNKIRRNL